MNIHCYTSSVSPSSCYLSLKEKALCRSIQHVFDKNAVAGCGVVDKDMSNGTYQFSVLDNR